MAVYRYRSFFTSNNSCFACYLYFDQNNNLFARAIKVILLIIYSFVTCSLICPSDNVYSLTRTGLEGLQVIGLYKIEIFHALSALFIFIAFPFYRKYLVLKFGFLFISISETIQIINIIHSHFNHPGCLYSLDHNLFFYEWITAVIGIVFIPFIN